MYNIGLIVSFILPGAIFRGVQWGDESDYNNIEWLDDRPKPNWVDILANDTPAMVYQLKQAIISQIDSNTAQIINTGFEFDESIFSLSQSAQSNWNALNLFYSRTKQDIPAAAWYAFDQKGFPVPTKNDGNYYLSYEKADGFFGAIFPIVTGIIHSGTNEKESVYKINTVEELISWSDSRL